MIRSILTRKMSKSIKRKNPESTLSKTQKPVQSTLIPINRAASGKGVFSKPTISISCWNVNGIRACSKKPGFTDFISRESADILCFNETKIQQIHVQDLKPLFKSFPYQYWSCSTTKLGYSGTAILSKVEPISWEEGLQGHPQEGRVSVAEFDTFYVVCTYVPNSGTDRFDYRINSWDPDLHRYLKSLENKGKAVIWIGDLNVINLDIDIHKLKGNEKHAGATPEERKSFHNRVDDGFFDSFRALYPEKIQFSWFSAISKTSREKNQGWRIDMAVLSNCLRERLVDSIIHDDVMGSDHHPVEVIIRNLN